MFFKRVFYSITRIMAVFVTIGCWNKILSSYINTAISDRESFKSYPFIVIDDDMVRFLKLSLLYKPVQ